MQHARGRPSPDRSAYPRCVAVPRPRAAAVDRSIPLGCVPPLSRAIVRRRARTPPTAVLLVCPSPPLPLKTLPRRQIPRGCAAAASRCSPPRARRAEPLTGGGLARAPARAEHLWPIARVSASLPPRHRTAFSPLPCTRTRTLSKTSPSELRSVSLAGPRIYVNLALVPFPPWGPRLARACVEGFQSTPPLARSSFVGSTWGPLLPQKPHHTWGPLLPLTPQPLPAPAALDGRGRGARACRVRRG